MRLVKGFITVLLAMIVGSATAHAGANSKASLLLHVTPHVAKNFCTAPSDCQGVNTSGAVGNFYDVLLLVANHSDSVGVGGIEFGISYNPSVSQGVDIFSWTKCGDMEFSMEGWPQSGTGNVVTWVNDVNCKQTGLNLKVAGRFYIGVYSPDRLALTVRPVTGQVQVASCDAAQDDLTNNAQSPLGFADFGTGLGYNPCLNVVPTTPSTWTGIKTLFREP